MPKPNAVIFGLGMFWLGLMAGADATDGILAPGLWASGGVLLAFTLLDVLPWWWRRRRGD